MGETGAVVLTQFGSLWGSTSTKSPLCEHPHEISTNSCYELVVPANRAVAKRRPSAKPAV